MARHAFTRRHFVRVTAAAAATAVAGALPVLSSCRDVAGPGPTGRSRLIKPPDLDTGAAVLTAAPGSTTIGEGDTAAAWLFNASLPGPTLRARRGDTLRVDLVNALPDPTIVHWHGMLVPEDADGHPRHVVGPGASYAYAFPIVQRAGTYWYHPHAHHRTAEQIHRGMAGFFVVTDDEEASLGLPAGDREILLLLQDREASAAGALAYDPSDTDLHAGMLRGTPYANGVRLPALDVVAGCYRFRLVNASHARVYRLAFDSGLAFTVIGNDGGLLPAAVNVPSVWLGVGERLDLLVDFTSLRPGARAMLRSVGFDTPGAAGTFPQGMDLDILEISRVEGTAPGMPSLPPVLSTIAPLGGAVTDRTFEFQTTSDAEMHRIDGRTFDMDRVDLTVPFGVTERWVFRNDSTLPHPVHLHGTQFQIVARTGGRGSVLAYEAGWKDTALVMPGEAVEALVRFDAYRGLFLLHCHNLQHEDMGMMLNVEVA